MTTAYFSKSYIFPSKSVYTVLYEAARVNTMTGGLDLSFGFPGNGKILYPH